MFAQNEASKAAAVVDQSFVLAQASGAIPIDIFYSSTADVVKTIALVLGGFLPVLGIWWSIRREMHRKNETATVGSAGLMAIGGALASHGDTMLYIDALAKQSKSLDIQSEALNELADSNRRLADANLELARTERQSVEQVGRAAEESIKIRKAIEEISDIIRRREQRGAI